MRTENIFLTIDAARENRGELIREWFAGLFQRPKRTRRVLKLRVSWH